MSRGVIARIFKTKLALKIWFYMVLPTLAVLLFIDISINIYFNKYTIANSLSNAQHESSYVASSFSDTYTDILKRFVLKTSSTKFKAKLKKILRSDKADYINVNNDLQDVFTEYTQINNLIKSVMIAKTNVIATDSMLFHSYNWRLKKDIQTYDLGFDLSQTTGISILSHSAKPFSNQSEVIPIVIPLQYTASSNLVLIVKNSSEADVILYLFLGTTEVKNYLELYCKDNSQGTLYLVNADGENLSLTSNQTGADIANSNTISSAIKTTIANSESYSTSGSNHIYINQINDINLYLVNVIPHEFFTTKSDSIRTALLWIALISVLIITCLSLMISTFVTRPLKKLMGSVHDIETNVYSGMANIKTKDEIGQLNQSINSLYNTIQQQFLTIKLEEKEKYNAKMQLLSEQINPHFLYNALEFINMEIFNDHKENATSMISSLGDYLRISLAYGESQLLISQEIDQVMAYVNIMNFRFHNSIQVSTQIPDNLLYHKIPKCILQSLVENSLKHGFKVGINNSFPILPIITISITLDDTNLTLTVTDNGAGIDISKAEQIMQNQHADNSTDKHMGLNNIYQRLTAYYGDVKIEFCSLPFFENKVIITLPAHFFTD